MAGACCGGTDRGVIAAVTLNLDKSDDDTLTGEQEQLFKALTTVLKKELRKRRTNISRASRADWKMPSPSCGATPPGAASWPGQT